MKTSPAELESEIRRIGQQLAAGSSGHVPTLFNTKWWASTLLELCMKDEQFKVQMFRFIDVLPSLKQDEAVARLVEEYFGESSGTTSPLHWGLRAISGTRLGAHLSAKSLRYHIHQMARTFIAGATIKEALPVLANMWTSGRGYSVDLLGEATVSEPEADHYRDRCLEALRLLGDAAAVWPTQEGLECDHLGSVPRINLSIKLSALYSQLDPIDPEGSYRAVARRLGPIFDLALTLPAAITFDMEQAESKDLTLIIFKRLLSERAYSTYPYAGIALQAYLKDTGKDLDSLIHWVRRRSVPISVRLVKGAYWDSDTVRYKERGWPVPVFEKKSFTDASYEALSRTLIKHVDVIRPALGTHNMRSLAHALATADAAGLAANALEFQMIFGMADPLQSAVVEMGRRVRIYTPVGELIPGMAYLVRRLLENTSNESFLRQEYTDTKPLDALLAPPGKVALSETDKPEESHMPPGPTGDPSDKVFMNEPHTDFSLASSCDAMVKALARVKRQLGRTMPYPVPSGVSPSGQDLVSVNPSLPSQVVGRVKGFAPSEMEPVARVGLASFSSWSAVSPGNRADILNQAADIMRKERFELAAWEIFEGGKPWREADADVAEAIDFLEFYASQMRRIGRTRRLGREPGELNHIQYVPSGLVAVLSPWNFPLAIPTGMVSAALVTGNVVLFKPSERAPLMGAHLVRVLTQAGVPEGVLQLVQGGPEIGKALVGYPDVQVIAFTGSKEVGLKILVDAAHMESGQKSIKRVIAEMGGKNAIIVDETADMDEAIIGVVASFTGYQGQKCSACSRAIVHESIYEAFLQRIKEAVLSLNVGPPEEPRNRMGPVIDERARDKVREFVEVGKREGRLVVAREVLGPGYFIGPAVFADIQTEDRLAQEEIFGPVLAVLKAKDFEEAIQIANASSYALTGGIYSRSPTNIKTACEEFDVGNLYINRPITGSLVGRQPFGGHRLSGVGAKAGGEDYLSQFMVARVISENTLRRGFAPTA